METIDDIRNEEGNPRAQPVGGPPRSVFKFFSATTGGRLITILLVALGLILLLAGAFLFIAPLTLAGLAIIIVSGVGYMWIKRKYLPA